MKRSLLITLISIVVLALIIFFAIKILTNVQYNTSEDNQKGIRIIDGDTFETSKGETIRLLCVDTPEIGENGYEEASDYLSSLILGKDITIEREGFDNYNRTLAWIYSGDVLVNKEIVDNGFGELFEYNGTDCERMK